MEPHEHKFNESYYGWKCECGLFYPFGCAPWEESDTEFAPDDETDDYSQVKVGWMGDVNGVGCDPDVP